MERNVQGKQWIDGAWVAGAGAAWERRNPFDGSVVWRGAWGSVEQARDALRVAGERFLEWSRRSLEERIAIVTRFAEEIGARREAMNQCIVRETGKPKWEADTETSTVIGKVANSIEAIRARRWSVSERQGEWTATTRFRPLGAMVVLGPFNLPAHLPGAHIVPALLAGNTVVFKPSEQTPGVAELLVEAWQAAGLPAGVLNMVHGAGEVAQALVHDETCSGVLFTGSYRVGKLLHEAMAGRPEVMLALEMGGNNALVLDRTEAIDAAVYQIILSAYITSGQRCTCARRLIITEDGNGAKILERLQEVLPAVTFGDPNGEPPNFMGSLISEAAAETMLKHQADLVKLGAGVLHKMERQAGNPAVLSPGLLDMGMAVLPDGEWFGPLLVVQRARDLSQAIEMANATRFGLSAGLISDSAEAYEHFVHTVKAGIVNWNRQTTGASGKLPFGGIGSSGNHRPSGSYASDYCSFPVASLESQQLVLPGKANPGLESLLRCM